MARSDRLLRLLHAMRTMAAPITAARLAEETDVSLRSLYRDIDALRAAGARIEGERGYGYRLVEDPALPPQTLDQGEIEALALGLAEVRAMGDPTLAKAAGSVLAKIAAILPDEREQQLVHTISRVFRPDPRYAATIDLAPIRAACWREEAVCIRYRDGEEVDSERKILPLALVYNNACITVLSWCCLRQDFRMFRTDRIADVRCPPATDDATKRNRTNLGRLYAPTDRSPKVRREQGETLADIGRSYNVSPATISGLVSAS